MFSVPKNAAVVKTIVTSGLGAAIAEKNGFCPDMKQYKANPEAFKGSVADVSMFLRVAVTGKLNAPDMYTVMQIIGYDRVVARINAMIDRL